MPSRPGRRWPVATAVLLALSVAALLFGGIFSALAPCGSWDNAVFGVRMWNESDPGGYYIASAHEFYSSHGRLLYPGHPGLPLQILLNALQVLAFMIFGGGSEFTAFIAKHVARIFFLSKLMMTALHVLSFWLLYDFARKLLGRERPALLCVLGYATSLPVLYYLSRVSVEPLMAIFFLATFLFLWDCEENLERRHGGRALASAALAGAAAVSGLATKFHLLWPLPAVGLLHLCWGGGVPFRSKLRLNERARRPALLAYAAGAALLLGLYSRLLDWRDFFAYWDVTGMSGGSASGVLAGLALRQAGILHAIFLGLGRMPLANWLPGLTKSGLFLFCELPLLAAAAYGAVNFKRREKLFWPAVATAYTLLIWLYRAVGVSGDFHDFHYLFVFMLLACVFFGLAADGLLARITREGSRKEAALIVLGIALVHAAPIWAAFDTRVQDAKYFGLIRAFPNALETTKARELVEVTGSRPFPVGAVLGLGVIRDTPPAESALLDAVSSNFVFGAGADPRAGAVVRVAKLGGISAASGPYSP